MFRLQELAERWGEDYSTLYYLFNEARDLLRDHYNLVRVGNTRAIELTDNGYKILERLRQYRDRFKSVQRAVEKVKMELQDAPKEPWQIQNALEAAYWRGIAEERERIISRLDKEIAELKEENKQLRKELEELKSRHALVEYRQSRKWWQFWRGKI